MDIMSPGESELGSFLDGILFSPDSKSTSLISAPVALNASVAPSTQMPRQQVAAPTDGRFAGKGKSTEALMALATKKPSEGRRAQSIKAKPAVVKKPVVEKKLPPALLVAPAGVTPKDLILLSGSGAVSQPAKKLFRALVTANSGHFQTLSTKERETYAAEFWNTLKEKGHRFLKPRSKDYEILDDARCINKIHLALKDCRTNNGAPRVDVAAFCDSFNYSKAASKPPPPKKHKKAGNKSTVALPQPVKEKSFDETARASIATMMGRREIANAQLGWSETKKQAYEDRLLYRFRMAAQNGMSCQEFSGRLLPLLLKEIEDGKGKKTGGV